MADPGEPPRKKHRIENNGSQVIDSAEIRQRRSAFLSTFQCSVTPPLRTSTSTTSTSTTSIADAKKPGADPMDDSGLKTPCKKCNIVRSPFRLTSIRDLPRQSNVDTLRLEDILGDPMIKECWQFNYLFDVDWLMTHFDSDVRNIVQVKIVHGSWKREAPNKIGIDEACQRWANVNAVTAYLPDPFGTHHSKMMILMRHDDLAQVVIHTANMIKQDWTNMSQAVWQSPLLPLKALGLEDSWNEPIGSGHRFKQDLLAYLNGYRDQYGNHKLGDLVKKLKCHDFSFVKAALVASSPSKLKIKETRPNGPLWGWPALKRVLQMVPEHGLEKRGDDSKATEKKSPRPRIVLQVSSVATLGGDDKYLKETMFVTLSSTASTTQQTQSTFKPSDPIFSIIFPTADTIRESLDGYTSGSSIHMKTQSFQQQKQLQYLQPYLYHWSAPATPQTRRALRRRAAPHIKTYIKFKDTNKLDEIDWALVTSANLSTQAWGSAVTSQGEVRVKSYEIGVLVWPELFVPEAQAQQEYARNKKIVMAPTFGTDYPDIRGEPGDATVVGLRMPYDLPLTKYSGNDSPWCATMNHPEPDWMGRVWGGYEDR